MQGEYLLITSLPGTAARLLNREPLISYNTHIVFVIYLAQYFVNMLIEYSIKYLYLQLCHICLKQEQCLFLDMLVENILH